MSTDLTDQLLPSGLDGLKLPAWLPIAVDTETNGLYADDGARVSVVSLAWVDPDIVTDPDPERLREAVKTGEGVFEVAFPFSQGIWCGPKEWAILKPGQQEDLFGGENPNLGIQEWGALIAWLFTRQSVVFHNAKFDMEKMRYAPMGWPTHDPSGAELWGIDFELVLAMGRMRIWDTQVCCPKLWPNEETSSLKPTGARLWGLDATAEYRALKPYLGPAKDPRYDLVPWPVIGPYASKDTNLTIRLAYTQWAILGIWGEWAREDAAQLRWLCNREIKTMLALYRMERAGIPYDAPSSFQVAGILDSKRLSLENRLPFRPTPKEAGRFFFSDGQIRKGRSIRQGLGLLPYKVTEKGAISFTAEVVDRLIKAYPADTEAGQAARIWQEVQKLNTAVSMWYQPYASGIGADKRLRTCFRQVTRGRGDEDGGTRSGRFSVERVNLQAIPHDYRLVIGEDKTWDAPTPRQLIGRAMADLKDDLGRQWHGWEFDLKQAELRVAASFARCTPMLEAFASGRDLHTDTTLGLFPKLDKQSKEFDFYRQIGKRGNFSLCFGSGGATFAGMVAKETGVQLDEAEADRIVETWNGMYPQYRRAIDSWSRVVDAERKLVLAGDTGFATGGLRVFKWGEDSHKAFNQLVQASLAEFLKSWMIEVTDGPVGELTRWVPGVGWVGLIMTIHDSLVALLPEGEEEHYAGLITGAAYSVWQRFFNTPDPLGRVLPVDGGAEGKRWG